MTCHRLVPNHSIYMPVLVQKKLLAFVNVLAETLISPYVVSAVSQGSVWERPEMLMWYCDNKSGILGEKRQVDALWSEPLWCEMSLQAARISTYFCFHILWLFLISNTHTSAHTHTWRSPLLSVREVNMSFQLSTYFPLFVSLVSLVSMASSVATHQDRKSGQIAQTQTYEPT